MKLKVRSRDSSESEIAVQPGMSVMEAIRDSGNDELLAICGGCCSCATCHVFVDAEWFDALPPPNEMESALLDTSAHRQPHSRLSCQLVLTENLNGLCLEIAPED